MKWKVVALFAVVVCLGVVANAQAGFHFLPAAVVNPGDEVQLKYNNYENVVKLVGQQLYGVGFVSSIIARGSDTVWSDRSTDGGELTLIFRDYTLRQITTFVGPTGTQLALFFTGGEAKIYWDSTPDRVTNPVTLSTPQGSNAAPDPTGTFSDGIPWLSAVGTPGVTNFDDPGTAFNETTATLISTIGSLELFSNGQGQGLFDVDLTNPALMNSFFDANPGWLFNPTADLKLLTHVNDYQPGSPNKPHTAPGEYPVRSFDPIFGTTIPEPSSVFIWCVLAVGSFIALRRRR